MERAFEINDKLMILSIIIGFVLGIYLAIGHDNPDLWFIIVQWIFVVSVVMTLIPTIIGIHRNFKYDEKFSLLDLIRMFVLNFAVIAVCTSFGFVFGSILIGNYIID